MSTPVLNEYEFKGLRLQAFSKGRLTLALAAGVRVQGNVSIKDVLGIIFICLADPTTRVLAQTDTTAFWQKEEEWENELNLSPEDFQPATELVKKLLDEVTATKAEPLDTGDMSQLPDPIPNELSQTI